MHIVPDCSLKERCQFVVASERYETYGQLGAPGLKGIHNVAICCDLLHLMKDIVEAMLKWHVICAESCGVDDI